MVKPNNIWDKVHDNLKNAIDNISDETTEIMVIPFANNSATHPTLKPITAFADSKGKAFIKAQIGALKPNTHTMTYHYIPLEDFYNNRVRQERVTYMFLMTDGLDDDSTEKAKKILLPQWEKKFGEKNVFGFFVILAEAARDPQINSIIDNQKHLWKVETADVNINLIRLQTNAIFNAKNDKYIDIPIYGNPKGMDFEASFIEQCPYQVTKTERKGNSLRIWVVYDKEGISQLSNTYHIGIKMKGGGNFDFLVSDRIQVKCEYKAERSLNISVI